MKNAQVSTNVCLERVTCTNDSSVALKYNKWIVEVEHLKKKCEYNLDKAIRRI